MNKITYVFSFSRQGYKQLSQLPTAIQRRITQKLKEYRQRKNPLEHAKKLHGKEM